MTQFYNTMPERLASLPLILVSGQARSGTTILTRAIAAHPQVLSNERENVWLRDMMQVVGDTLHDRSRVNQLSVSSDTFVAAFRDTARKILFPDATVPGDIENVRALSTFSSLRFEMFDALPLFWPNFYLLNIVRSGIEVVASRLKHQHISATGDFETHCVAWAHSIDIVRWIADRPELKERFFLVRHEQLLNAETCEELFAQMQHQFGLDHSDACARFVAENHVSKNADRQSQHSPQSDEGADARKSIWKYWTPEERSIFESVCSEAMRELGYDIPW